MLRALTRHVTALYDDHLRPSGLTLAQYSTLAKLHRMGSTSLVALARESELDTTTMCRSLRPLVSAGLVLVSPGKNGRTKAFSLTQAGEHRFDEAHALWQQAERAMRSLMSDAQRQELDALREQIAS